MGTKTSTGANDKNGELTVKLLKTRKNRSADYRNAIMRCLRGLGNKRLREVYMILPPHVLIHGVVADDDPFPLLVLSSGSWAWIFVLAGRLRHDLGVPADFRPVAHELGPILR